MLEQLSYTMLSFFIFIFETYDDKIKATLMYSQKINA